MKELFIFILLSFSGMLLSILLDVRKHLNDFAPAIWWRDNQLRLLLTVITLIVLNTIVFLAPGVEGFLANFIEIKTPITSKIGAVVISMTVTSMYIVGVKKAELT